jgi:hypothetical protein
MPIKQESILEAFAAVAIRLDADEMEVEYEEGHEQIYAFKGEAGLGIGRLPRGAPRGGHSW